MKPSTFPERLRDARLKRKLTIAQLAAMAGVAKSTQQTYEAGTRTPDYEYIVRLARHGFDYQFLMFGEVGPVAEPNWGLAAKLLDILREAEKQTRDEIPADKVMSFIAYILREHPNFGKEGHEIDAGAAESGTVEALVRTTLRLVA